MGKKTPKKSSCNETKGASGSKKEEANDEVLFYRNPERPRAKETCEYCCQDIRGELIKCKCFYTFFCSESCRKKSVHYKQLCKGGDVKTFLAAEIDEAVRDKIDGLKISTSEEKRKLRTELMEVAGKSFEDLMNMQENSSALYVLGLAWDRNFNMKNSEPLVPPLPEEQSQLDYRKRNMKAGEYLIKSCEAGNLLAMYILFCESSVQVFNSNKHSASPVSYTHLTLPTILLV